MISHDFTSKCFNSLIRKTNIFACDRFHMHCGIDKFWFTCRKLITTIGLRHYVNLKAYFNLNKFGNLSIQFEKQTVISIQSFFILIGWKQPTNHFKALNVSSMSKFEFLCLIRKVDFCLANVNLRMSKWFATLSIL